MGFQPHARIHSVEILDQGTASNQEIHDSLGDLRRINAWLGGRRVLGQLLREQVRRTGLGRFSLLDLGSASGDLPAFVARDFDAQVIGIDRQLRHLREKVGNHWMPVCGDALALPFPPRSFDFVAASLLLHQFSDHDAVTLLKQMALAARHAVIVNDLERHAIAWYFIRMAPVHAISRADGAASVQQAFTKDELESLATRAGFAGSRVRKHVPFRLSLVAELS